MVIKKFDIIIGIFIFLNLILLSFASGAAVAAWKDSYCKDCDLPWGGSIHSDLNKTAWLSSSVPCGSTCTSETRICSNGTLSGSYTYSSCYVLPCEYCGDGLCNNGETCSSCPGDCGVCPPTYSCTYPIDTAICGTAFGGICSTNEGCRTGTCSPSASSFTAWCGGAVSSIDGCYTYESGRCCCNVLCVSGVWGPDICL